jgi:hypothetical protein
MIFIDDHWKAAIRIDYRSAVRAAAGHIEAVPPEPSKFPFVAAHDEEMCCFAMLRNPTIPRRLVIAAQSHFGERGVHSIADDAPSPQTYFVYALVTGDTEALRAETIDDLNPGARNGLQHLSRPFLQQCPRRHHETSIGSAGSFTVNCRNRHEGFPRAHLADDGGGTSAFDPTH